LQASPSGGCGGVRKSRSRFDEKLTGVIVMALGVLIAPTPAGQGI